MNPSDSTIGSNGQPPPPLTPGKAEQWIRYRIALAVDMLGRCRDGLDRYDVSTMGWQYVKTQLGRAGGVIFDAWVEADRQLQTLDDALPDTVLMPAAGPTNASGAQADDGAGKDGGS